MFALLATVLAAEPLTVNADPCEAYNDRGEPFVTCFDAGKGLELGGYGGVLGLSPSSTFTAAVKARGMRDSRTHQGVVWFNDHRVASLTVRPGAQDRALSLVAYEGLYRRHVDEGFLLLPTTPPIKLPFPLDVGLAVSAARWERVVADGWAFETARITLFFDAVRAPTARFHFGLGPTLSHRMRGGLSGPLTHELMPLTGAQGLAALESEDGRWSLRAEGVAGWTFAPGGAQGTFRARGELSAERVLLAINDQPIALTVRATAAWHDLGASATSEWTLQAGFTVRLFSAQ